MTWKVRIKYNRFRQTCVVVMHQNINFIIIWIKVSNKIDMFVISLSILIQGSFLHNILWQQKHGSKIYWLAHVQYPKGK
jgi:hypothetical protein